MLKSKLNLALAAALLCGGTTVTFGQEPTPLLTQKEAQWITVLKSNASQKEKADACRELAIIGTKAAVPALVALLPDETMNHMARYALETIPSPAVDEALRAALGRLKGRPLVGVIGSLGVRRDVKATDALAKFLSDADGEVVQAAARSLGKLGGAGAVKALDSALDRASGDNQLAICEGLFRCAEAMVDKGQRDKACAIYDRLRGLTKGAHQVRAGGLRGAILTRGKAGLPVLIEALRSSDWVLVAAAAKTALEMPGDSVSRAVAAELGKGSADKQILLTQVLGRRGDAVALPALSTAAKKGDKNVRLAAIRALPEIRNVSAVPVLVELVGDADREIAQTAQESLAGLPGAKVDAAVMNLLYGGDSQARLAAIELIARRRMTDAIPALLVAGTDKDAKIRPAAIRKVGELGDLAVLPMLLDMLNTAKGSQDLDAVEEAVGAVCKKAEKPDVCSERLIGLLPQARPEQKSALLRVLSTIGGPAALTAVRGAVSDANADVHAAAIRALGSWKTADAAPALLELARNAGNPTDRMLSLRSYLALAGQSELPADQRLSMCKQTAGLLKNAQEKKMLLGTLGGIQTVSAVAVLLPYLNDTEVKSEASAGVLAIAGNLLQGRNGPKFGPKLIDPLKKVLQANASAPLVKRANVLLQTAQGGKK